MLSLMHEADPYGELRDAGQPLAPSDLVQLLGGTIAEVKRLLKELEDRNVFSRCDDGAIFSRRMRRDFLKAQIDRENGKGGGNPKLKPSDNQNQNQMDNQIDETGLTPPIKLAGGSTPLATSTSIASEEESLAKPVSIATRGNGRHPPNPCVNDPPEAWLALTNDEGEWTNGSAGPLKRAVVGDFYLDDAARLVTEAAGINDANWRGDWRPLVSWLNDKLDLHDAILPAIRRVADRPGYVVPRSLAYFDQAVREGRAAA